MPFPRELVDRAEAGLGVRSPPIFVASMMQLNGGSVHAAADTWELHTFLDTSDRRRLRTARAEIAQETERARKHPGLPDGVVTIASNGTSELLGLLPGREEGEPGEQDFFWTPDDASPQPAADDLFERRSGRAGLAP